MELVKVVRRINYHDSVFNIKYTENIILDLEKNGKIEDEFMHNLNLEEISMKYRENKDLYHDFFMMYLDEKPLSIADDENIQTIFSFTREEWDNFLFTYVNLFSQTVNNPLLNNTSMNISLGRFLFNLIYNFPNEYIRNVDYSSPEVTKIKKKDLKTYQLLKNFNYYKLPYFSYVLFTCANYLITPNPKTGEVPTLSKEIIDELPYYNYMYKQREYYDKINEKDGITEPLALINYFDYKDEFRRSKTEYFEFLHAFDNSDLQKFFKIKKMRTRVDLLSFIVYFLTSVGTTYTVGSYEDTFDIITKEDIIDLKYISGNLKKMKENEQKRIIRIIKFLNEHEEIVLTPEEQNIVKSILRVKR